jgi:hypothetical protein
MAQHPIVNSFTQLLPPAVGEAMPDSASHFLAAKTLELQPPALSLLRQHSGSLPPHFISLLLVP